LKLAYDKRLSKVGFKFELRRYGSGDGLITQAYAALLVAFLIEGQPALRADVAGGVFRHALHRR